MEKLRNVAQLRDLRNDLIAKMDPNQTCVRICMTGCRARGAEQVREKTAAMSREQELRFWQEHSRNLCQRQAEIRTRYRKAAA